MRRALVVSTIVGLAVVGLATGVAIRGTHGSGNDATPLSAKQTAERFQAIANQTLDAGVHPTKPADPTPIASPGSCSRGPNSLDGLVTGSNYMLPPYPEIFEVGTKSIKVANLARAVGSDGAPHVLYGGALNSDPTQGVIVDWQLAKDPCAEARIDYPPREFLTPDKSGPRPLRRSTATRFNFKPRAEVRKS
jgi:hypothetical protein